MYYSISVLKKFYVLNALKNCYSFSVLKDFKLKYILFENKLVSISLLSCYLEQLNFFEV